MVGFLTPDEKSEELLGVFPVRRWRRARVKAEERKAFRVNRWGNSACGEGGGTLERGWNVQVTFPRRVRAVGYFATIAGFAEVFPSSYRSRPAKVGPKNPWCSALAGGQLGLQHTVERGDASWAVEGCLRLV